MSNDPPARDVVDLAASLSEARRQSSSGGVYLLWDQSGTPDAKTHWRRFATAPWRSLLDRDHAQPDEASPVIFDLSGIDRSDRLKDALQRLCEYARYANALSLVDSPLGLDGFTSALHERAMAQLPDQLAVVLRFFDTRVAPLLATLLTDEQYAGFMNCADSWYYLDRAGRACAMPRSSATGSFAGPLVFNSHQERVLIDDGLCDAVIDQLLDLRHPALRGLNPEQQHTLVTRLAQAAQRAGIGDVLEVVQFCCAAHQHGEDFAARAPWSERLAYYRAGTMPLAQALSDVA